MSDELPDGQLKRRRPEGARHRWAVASRVAAALLGGYLMAYASAALMTVVLPMSRINRAVTASLLSFVVWAAVAIWVFAAPGAWRAWWTTLAAGVAMLVLAMIWRDQGMRP